MDFSTEIKGFFLYCVRLGIGTGIISCFKSQDSGPIDWKALEDLAAEQGLSAVLVDGVELLPERERPPQEVLLQWIGETIQGYEYRYEQYIKAISELAAFYNRHGFKMMILKGYACALDWPKPEHRPCGDIDIWQFGEQKAADAVLAGNTGIRINRGRHHHTVFYWKDFMVENHYDFVNVYSHRESKDLEKIFKQLGEDDNYSIELGVGNLESVDSEKKSVEKVKVYFPSPNLHALFLIRHALNHFAASGIIIRQVLDWAFFVKAHTKEIDWVWLDGLLEKFHMKDFYDCLNAICVEDLGFPVEIFPRVQFVPVLKERVLNDILSSGCDEELPKSFKKRIIFKIRRWRNNAWKRELCFEECGLSSFIGSIWSHLLKPNSI